jgi:hypothetical protein
VSQDLQAKRAAVIEQLIERFAPVNEDELALLCLNQALPAWILVATDKRAPERARMLPLHHLDKLPPGWRSGWSALAVVGLDCDIAYVPGFCAGPTTLAIDELLGW